jgi:hypothetical protein
MWNQVRHARADEGQLVEPGVADGRDAGPMRGTAGVDLHVHPDRFRHVGDLHGTGDPEVVFPDEVDHVAAAGEGEGRLLLGSRTY